MPFGPDETLGHRPWTARAAAHERRVDRLIADRLSRAACGRKHPGEDFLFSYRNVGQCAVLQGGGCGTRRP